jgi:hypothetical protein
MDERKMAVAADGQTGQPSCFLFVAVRDPAFISAYLEGEEVTNTLDMVRDLHKAFDVPIADKPYVTVAHKAKGWTWHKLLGHCSEEASHDDDPLTVMTARGEYTYSLDDSDPSKGPWPFEVKRVDMEPKD